MGFKAYLQLLRVPLLFLGCLASLAVVSMCGQLHTFHAWLAIMLASLVNASFNIYNEICDVETDRITKLNKKPLARREISVDKAMLLFSSLLLISIGLTIYYNLITGNLIATLIAVLGICFSYLYDAYGKKTGVLGNVILMVPYTLSILFLLQDCGMMDKHWMFSLGFGITTFSFNVCTLYQDIPSDKRAGLYTAPMQLGRASSFVGVLTSQTANILYIYSPIPPLSKLFFTITNMLVTATSMLLVYPPESMWVDKGVEWLCRILARITLMASFILMLLGK